MEYRPREQLGRVCLPAGPHRRARLVELPLGAPEEAAVAADGLDFEEEAAQGFSFRVVVLTLARKAAVAGAFSQGFSSGLVHAFDMSIQVALLLELRRGLFPLVLLFSAALGCLDSEVEAVGRFDQNLHPLQAFALHSQMHRALL